MTADRDQEILSLYRNGVLLKDIGLAVGLAPNTVGQILKRLGEARPPKPQKRPRPSLVDEQKIIAAWGRGLSTSAISEFYAVSQSAVYTVLRDAGIDLVAGGHIRTRYDNPTGGGSGRSGFAGNMARRS